MDISVHPLNQLEREQIEFDTPTPWEKIRPGTYRPCSACGADSQPLPAAALTAFRRHFDNHPLGEVSVYCPEHLYYMEGESVKGISRPRRKTGEVCPTCFMEMPLSGICDECS